MKKINISAIAAAISFAFSAGAMAQTLSKDEYKTQKAGITEEYKSASKACGSFAGNVKDVCMAEAKGKENVAKAELDARNKPGLKADYQVRVAKAETDYAVAKEKCDDKAGNAKDICVKEAKSLETAAKADAKAQLKTAEANKVASEKSAKAHTKADQKSSDAKQDAATAKRDAEYAVAKEKCDALSGDAKNGCLATAKARYGKS